MPARYWHTVHSQGVKSLKEQRTPPSPLSVSLSLCQHFSTFMERFHGRKELMQGVISVPQTPLDALAFLCKVLSVHGRPRSSVQSSRDLSSASAVGNELPFLDPNGPDSTVANLRGRIQWSSFTLGVSRLLCRNKRPKLQSTANLMTS